MQNEVNFLSISPSRRQKIGAGVLAVLIISVTLVTLPFAKIGLPEIHPFLPAFIALIFGMDTLTGYLFLRQFTVTKSIPLLVLSGTYFFSSWITIPHILTFPDVFSSTGLLGAGSQTAVWFWVVWHGGFSIGILIYLFSRKIKGINRVRVSVHVSMWAMLGFIAVLVVLLMILFTKYHNDLPVIVEKGNYHVLVTSGVGPVVLLLNVVALIGVIVIGRAKNILHLWLILAVLASMLDVLVTLYAGARYSLGWYVARLNSLLSAGTVFSIFLFELNRLYVALSHNNVELERAQIQLMNSFQEIEAQSEELQTQNEEILSYQQQQDVLLTKLQDYTVTLEQNNGILEGKQKELQALYQEMAVQEERYRTLTNFLPDGLAVVQNGDFVFMNQACAVLFGLSSTDEWLGQSMLSIISPEYREVAKRRTDRIINKREIPPLIEYKMTRKDQSLMDIEISGTFILYEGVPAILVALRDITKRKQMEKQLKEMNAQLEKLAHSDGLTGIFNRRSFDHYLNEEWERAFSNSSGLSLILFDIDYFKAYNDTYGHQSGDEVLKQVAKALDQITVKKNKNRAFRYGGEEFAVILPETEIEEAIKIADTIRLAIQRLAIIHENSKVSNVVTGSFGVASVVPVEAGKGRNLIEQADQALYQAKHSGRNQVAIFTK